MSDINDKELDELENEEEIENYITLTDDDGNEVSFEIIGTVEYKALRQRYKRPCKTCHKGAPPAHYKARYSRKSAYGRCERKL